MTGFILSPRARADLEDIWDYTVERWGEDQAEHYVRGIEAAIKAIAIQPTQGRACDEVRSGYCRYRIGSHFLFYRLLGSSIDVVRILHVSMDTERHL